MRKIFLLFIIIFSAGITTQAQTKKKSPNEFSFIFMTDIHYQPERGAAKAFEKAIEKANTLDADFVVTGGDLVYDVLRGNFNRADSLFLGYKNAIKKFKMPVYNCIGNHELFGIYKESDIDASHPDYKYGMYERHLGKTYYSFDHKGWHFIVLNTIDEKDQRYIGTINKEEMEWLKADIESVSKDTPIAMAMHIPFVSSYQQIYPRNPPTEVPNEVWVDNRNEVLNLLKGHNLKLVLQGHMHWIEDINVQNKTRFITGGSLAGRPSWRRMDNRNDGVYYNEEGFMMITIKGEDISWKYIDNEWEAKVDE